MKIEDLKKEILRKNPNLEFEIKKDLAFQVSKHFEEARIVKGLTQKELAQMVGTKQSNIARAENGRSLPSLSFLKRVAEALKTYLIPPKFAFMEEVNNTVVNSHSSSGSGINFLISPFYQPNAQPSSIDTNQPEAVQL